MVDIVRRHQRVDDPEGALVEGLLDKLFWARACCTEQRTVAA
jgi:hypothetical protein